MIQIGAAVAIAGVIGNACFDGTESRTKSHTRSGCFLPLTETGILVCCATAIPAAATDDETSTANNN